MLHGFRGQRNGVEHTALLADRNTAGGGVEALRVRERCMVISHPGHGWTGFRGGLSAATPSAVIGNIACPTQIRNGAHVGAYGIRPVYAGVGSGI